MKEFSKKNEYIVREVVSKEKALELFKDNPYKVEMIKELEGEISIYKQGDWFDLCLGVHGFVCYSCFYFWYFKF